MVTREASEPPEGAVELPGERGAGPASGAQLGPELRGFGPVGIMAMLVILLSGNVPVGNVVAPVGAILVLVWARWSRTPWREIGYARPTSWTGTLAAGLAFGVALKLLMKAIVLPLLGADPINPAYHYLAGNQSMTAAAREGVQSWAVEKDFYLTRLIWSSWQRSALNTPCT
jgi:hypothetical protein